MKDFKEIKASLDKEFQQAKADIAANPQNSSDIYNKIMDSCYSMFNNFASYMYDSMAEHRDNLNKHINPVNGTHAPHLKTASQVQSYLEACNMDQDFEIQKPTIYAKASRNGAKEFEIDLKLGKK